ncbi:MAG: tetratricopeptide repeat protein [Clostridiales bacterium]|jgi:serine/threonine protein kinase|nr:tetratricopeptide repeat protein [Clostridiales bacterium]
MTLRDALRHEDYILTLDDYKLQLLEEPIVGGSSFVYKARLVNNIVSGTRIVKEFWPHDLGVQRDSGGALFLPADSKKHEKFNELKKRVKNESLIAKELRRAKDNNNPMFMEYSAPVEKNNTLYTIIDTEDGKMLSTLIDSGFFHAYFSDIGIGAIFECFIKILDAVEPLHKKGYLHLDISPDNIHFSESKIARLIDFNSAVRADETVTLFSLKEGYSASELIRRNGNKIGIATDLFSVAAIFFELLIRRTPTPEDCAIPDRWFLNGESPYLKNASQLLIDKLNKFLQKGISATPNCRFQSVQKMRMEINAMRPSDFENDLKPDDPDTAKMFCVMGRTCHEQGNCTKALHWYEKALKIIEKDSETALAVTLYNNLAAIYSRLEDFEQTEKYFEKAMYTAKKIYGEVHPDIALILNNMAGTLFRLKSYGEALSMYEAVAEARKNLLGENHIDTATAYGNIASAHAHLNDFNTALHWYQKALPIHINILGKTHPRTIAIQDDINAISNASDIPFFSPVK